jgi:predicted glycoside hydrolase/deacetylase ChbG (UPF0249 family)
MPARLIINADDFGFSRAVTDGILHAHKNGVLTSTTLMTTMPDRDRAIDLAGQTPSLGVGIHLSLTQGTPLTACRKILTRDGRMIRSLPKLFLRLRSADARRQAGDELLAQIEYAKARGLVPTHVDSHKHVCHLPLLHGPLIAACQAAGVHWIRTAREARIPKTPPLPLAYRPLAVFAKTLARRVAAAGLRTNDWFFGLATTGGTTVSVYEALAPYASERPDAEVAELMVHPGYLADISASDTRLLQERITELEALTAARTRAALEAARVPLSHYGGMGRGCNV